MTHLIFVFRNVDGGVLKFAVQDWPRPKIRLPPSTMISGSLMYAALAVYVSGSSDGIQVMGVLKGDLTPDMPNAPVISADLIGAPIQSWFFSLSGLRNAVMLDMRLNRRLRDLAARSVISGIHLKAIDVRQTDPDKSNRLLEYMHELTERPARLYGLLPDIEV